MRNRVEYWIIKDYRNDPEMWDGPFTLQEARKAWEKDYRNTREVGCGKAAKIVEARSQDFIVAKVTYEQVLPDRRIPCRLPPSRAKR